LIFKWENCWPFKCAILGAEQMLRNPRRSQIIC